MKRELATTVKQKLQTRLAMSPSLTQLTPGQPGLALIPRRWEPIRAGATVPVFKSLG